VKIEQVQRRNGDITEIYLVLFIQNPRRRRRKTEIKAAKTRALLSRNLKACHPWRYLQHRVLIHHKLLVWM